MRFKLTKTNYNNYNTKDEDIKKIEQKEFFKFGSSHILKVLLEFIVVR